MVAYSYVKARKEDVEKLFDPTFFPPGFVVNLAEVLNEKCRIYVNSREGVFSRERVEGFDEYVEILNNYVVGIAVNPVEARTNLDIVVVYDDWGYLLPKGREVMIVEARGKGVYPLVEEGSRVSKGSRLFYVVTGKYEVRVIRSPVDGVLFVISELIPSEIQVYRAVIARVEDLVELKRIR